MTKCPPEISDAIRKAGGPCPTEVYNLRGSPGMERDDDGLVNFFKVYTNSGFDPYIGRDDDLGNGTHRCGVIPGWISASTLHRDPVAALLKGGTNIFVGFVFDTAEEGVQEIVHTLADDMDENPPDGWCVICGAPCCTEAGDEEYSDGVTSQPICQTCWQALGYERCGYCGEACEPKYTDQEGGYIDSEGWMCRRCISDRYPNFYLQWDDVPDDEKDALHSVALVEWEYLKGERAGQTTFTFGGLG
ncbi:MAG: hypothetical protein ACYC63_04665 [Armatimonadota bacterium]